MPTAGDMIWEFKQALFVSQRRASPAMVADLSSPGVRQQLQAHIDSLASLPRAGEPDEYSALFEAVYPSESDRRTYIDVKLAGAKPSYGHLALAVLMRANHARLVWTTNFDPLIADACAKVFGGTGALTTATLESAGLAGQAITEGRWPVEVKLHGDFRSRRLKNTDDELRHQDQQLRDTLVEACKRYGLIVVGYSGRDDSVMRTLESALEVRGAFPEGLFWLHYGGDAPHARVAALLSRAKLAGIECGLVRIENFDESLRDLVRMLADVDADPLEEFGKERSRWSAAPAPAARAGWPLIRMNAIRIRQLPTVCRRIVCEIGGYAEVREAVRAADVDLLVGRSQRGVLAFGTDAAARQAFSKFNITEFDLSPIEAKRLRYESAERGLLRDAIGRAIARARGLTLSRRGSMDLLFSTNVAAPEFEPLRAIVGGLHGTLSEFENIKWFEGVGIRLEWAADNLWILMEPTTVFVNTPVEARGIAADFGRERRVRRYNRQLNDLIDFWAKYIVGTGEELRALGIGDGVDAAFMLAPRTGFSRRATA